LKSSEKLKKIADLAGRMRRVAAAKQRQKSNYLREEVTDIEQGNDTARLLPSEVALLGDKDLEPLFFSKLVERKALQYKLSGKEKKGRGPIIICQDESGSMTGDPDVWAKAVSLGLLEVAQRQGRSWYFIHFAHNVTRVDKVVQSKEQLDPLQLMECMLHFSSGGTNFELPLIEAARCIEDDGGFEKADILLVTDGCCSTSAGFNETFRARIEKLDAKVITVLVNGIQAGKDVVEFSDEIFTLEEIVASATKSANFEDVAFSI